MLLAENRAIVKRRACVLKTRPQVRRTFPPEADLRALARSVMKRQLHPLIILTEPADTVLDGECRWRGLMLENPEHEVDCIYVDREMTPGEICEMQMISAMHSTSLTAYDQAVACKEWMEQNEGATAKVLAEKIDRDPSMLTRLLALWKTNPAVVQAASEGKIGPKAWYQISLLPAVDQDGLLAMHLSGMPADQITEASRKARAGKPAAPTVKVEKAKLLLARAVVQVTGEDLDHNAVLDVCQDLVKQIRKAIDDGSDIRAFQSLLAARVKGKKP